MSGFYKLNKLLEDFHRPYKDRQMKVIDLAKKKYLRKFIFGTVETNLTQD
jgi:hypothetical protein